MPSKYQYITLLPSYTTLEIEGHTFPVLESSDRNTGSGPTEILIQAVLRLAPEQLEAMQALLAQKDRLNIRRGAIDATPIVVRLVGTQGWSAHEEDGATYYKQWINLVPADAPAEFGEDLIAESLVEGQRANVIRTQRNAAPRAARNWRRTVGRFQDDPVMREIWETGRKIREAGRLP